MIKKIIYLNLITLFISMKVFSQTWVFSGEGKDGTKQYVRSEYLSKNNEGIKIWEKIEYPKLIIDKVVYTHAMEKDLVLINCDRKQYVLLQIVIFNKEGVIIQNYSFDDENKWINVVPDSMAEGYMLKVCELFDKKL